MSRVVESIPRGRQQHEILSDVINTMTSDDLTMQGAMATAVIVLTYFSLNIPVSAPEGLL